MLELLKKTFSNCIRCCNFPTKWLILPSLVCEPTSINSLNSPLSLSKEMPFELLCNLMRLGCLGGNPRGVEGAWHTLRWEVPRDCGCELWVKLQTAAESITLQNSISCNWLVSLMRDSSLTWNFDNFNLIFCQNWFCFCTMRIIEF